MSPATDPRPFVSVIVPVYNGERFLPGLLAALAAQDYPPARREIIIVDNASTDATAQIIAAQRLPGLLRVFEATPGSYAARNAGLAQASGTVLAFTDADCRPAPDWLTKGVAGLARDRLDVLAGQVRQAGEPRENLFQTIDRLLFMRQSWYVSQGFGATANLLVKREVLASLGGFDPRLLSNGDRVFCLQAQQAGYRLGYCHEAVVEHVTRATLAGLARKEFRLGLGFGQLARFYRPGPGLSLFAETYLPVPGLRACLPEILADLGWPRLLLTLLAYAVIRLPCRTWGFVQGLTGKHNPLFRV